MPKGYLPTDETRMRLSKALMGNQNFLGKSHSKETKEKMSKSKLGEKNPMYGRHHSEETKKKLSSSLKGIRSGENNPMFSISSEKHPQWKGDEAGYIAKHQWVRRHFGKASFCELNPMHSSKAGYEWHNISGNYNRNRDDWIQLCRSCHKEVEENGL